MPKKCPNCQQLHDDWEDAGSYKIDDGGYHAGVAERFECGWCGEIAEVVRR